MIDPLPISDDTVYDVRVTNLGPSAAESMVVTDAMPTSQVSYRSHTLPADGTCARFRRWIRWEARCNAPSR